MTDSASSVRNAVKRFRGFLTKLPGMAGALASIPGIFAPRNAGTTTICLTPRIGLQQHVSGNSSTLVSPLIIIWCQILDESHNLASMRVALSTFNIPHMVLFK